MLYNVTSLPGGLWISFGRSIKLQSFLLVDEQTTAILFRGPTAHLCIDPTPNSRNNFPDSVSQIRSAPVLPSSVADRSNTSECKKLQKLTTCLCSNTRLQQSSNKLQRRIVLSRQAESSNSSFLLQARQSIRPVWPVNFFNSTVRSVLQTPQIIHN